MISHCASGSRAIKRNPNNETSKSSRFSFCYGLLAPILFYGIRVNFLRPLLVEAVRELYNSLRKKPLEGFIMKSLIPRILLNKIFYRMANASECKCSNEIFHSHVENPHDVSHPCRVSFHGKKSLHSEKRKQKNKHF